MKQELNPPAGHIYVPVREHLGIDIDGQIAISLKEYYSPFDLDGPEHKADDKKMKEEMADHLLKLIMEPEVK